MPNDILCSVSLNGLRRAADPFALGRRFSPLLLLPGERWFLLRCGRRGRPKISPSEVPLWAWCDSPLFVVRGSYYEKESFGCVAQTSSDPASPAPWLRTRRKPEPDDKTSLLPLYLLIIMPASSALLQLFFCLFGLSTTPFPFMVSSPNTTAEDYGVPPALSPSTLGR